MKILRRILVCVAGVTLAVSLRAQALWPGTSTGMSVDEVQRMFLNAHPPQEPMGLPRGRGVELLQIESFAVAGRTFAVHFFFKDRALVHVSLTDSGIIDFKDFEKVRDVMRKRYNQEYTMVNASEYLLVTWKVAQTEVTLRWTLKGHDVATLEVAYDAPILKETGPNLMPEANSDSPNLFMNYVDANGDLTLQVDKANDVIRLKAVATFDEPVELGADQARELAQRLLLLAEEIE